jgi:hypothetical protein
MRKAVPCATEPDYGTAERDAKATAAAASIAYEDGAMANIMPSMDGDDAYASVAYRRGQLSKQSMVGSALWNTDSLRPFVADEIERYADYGGWWDDDTLDLEM